MPSLGPAAATAESSVHALGMKDSAGSDNPACDSHAWTLPLAAGGNDFTIAVGMGTPPVSSAGPVKTLVAPPQTLNPKPGNLSWPYQSFGCSTACSTNPASRQKQGI